MNQGPTDPETRGADGALRDNASELQRTLSELERRRWHLWVVAAVLLLAISTAVVILLGGGVVDTELPDSPALPWGFLGVSVAFLLYVADQERTTRRMTRALFEQRDHAASLEARVDDLTTLVDAARTVNSVLAPEEVFEVLLRSAMELAGASSGAVFLRIREQLMVAVSTGEQAPSRGSHVAVGTGPAGRAVETGEPQVVGGGVRDGQRVPSGVCAPLVVKGRRVGVLAVERDRTAPPFGPTDVSAVVLFAEHAAMAVANASRFEQERSRVEQLVDAAEQRAEFTARLVHDLRSPLVSMLGYARLLRDRPEELGPERRDMAFESLFQQGDRLQNMIDEVLTSASAEAGAQMRREPVEIRDLLEEARKLGITLGATRSDARTIVVEGAEDAGVVWGDPEALRHILSNLVENALKYSTAGSPVTLRASRSDHEVRLSVADQGRGIDPDSLGHVFERFRQHGQGGGGVGLGLYIVRTLVQAHGGAVEVESELGEGSEFTVVLPVRAEDRVPADA